MNFRYDRDPVFYDEKGYMWTEWMFRHFIALNEIERRNDAQNKEIDLIFDAASKGRKALSKLEEDLKKKSSL